MGNICTSKDKCSHEQVELKGSLCNKITQIKENIFRGRSTRKQRLLSFRSVRYLQYWISGADIGGNEQSPSRIQLHQHFNHFPQDKTHQ